MPRTDKAPALASLTKAQLLALIATLQSEPSEPSEASQHYEARDLPCTLKPQCDKTFRTVKGQTWHATNMQAAHKAK